MLGLATGSTPVLTYRELIRRHEAGGPSYDAVTAFTLDEYVGLLAGHPRVLSGDDRPRAHRPAGHPARSGCTGRTRRLLPDAGPAYEELIAEAGGVDLQVLGIGTDGHLAFNEPGSSLASRTRIKTLTEQTRSDNARFFGSARRGAAARPDPGPRHDPRARHLLLLATGEAKAAAVAAAVEGPLTASCPASVLQLHPHVSVLLDPEAASALARHQHYRDVHAAKPEWQGY